MLLPNDTQQFAFILISQFTLIERITYHPVALLPWSKKNEGLGNYNAIWRTPSQPSRYCMVLFVLRFVKLID